MAIRVDHRFVHTIFQETYLDLEMSNPGLKAPPAHLKELRRYTGAFDASELGLEDSYSLLTLRTTGEIPVVYMCHTGRKHNTASEGIFIQSEGWKQGGEALLEHFDDILGTTFYSEAEIDAFAAQGQVPAEESSSVREIAPVPVDKTAIRAILYATMLRWRQGTPQLHIAVPKAEMGRYNDYVLGAVKTIWSYFPAYMRAAVGFVSYLSPRRERDFPRFSVIFLPYHMADTNTIRLDGSSPNAYAALIRSTGTPELDALLDSLAEQDDPKERESFLAALYEDLEQGSDLQSRNFTPMGYVKWGRGLALLNDKRPAGERLPDWVKFAAGSGSYPQAISDKINAMIDRELDPETVLKPALIAELKGDRPKLRTLNTAVDKYWPLCRDRELCREKLWSFLSNGLGNSGLRPEEIHKALCDNKDSWLRLTDEAAYGECMVQWGNQTAQDMQQRMAKQLQEMAMAATSREYPASARLKADLEELRRQFREAAAPYVSEVVLRELDAGLEQEQRELMLGCLDKELAAESKVEPRGYRAIRAEQKKVTDLIDLLPADKSDAERELLGRMQGRQTALTELLMSARTVSEDLQEKVRGIADYFEALDEASTKADDLSDVDQDALRQILLGKRPKGRAAYYEAFRRRYGAAVSFRALSDRSAFFRRCVEEDLLGLYQGAQKLDMRDKNAGALLRQIQTLRKERELVGVEGRMSVDLGRGPVDAELAERVLSLEPKRAESLDGAAVEELGLQLAEMGCFGADQLPRLLELFDAAKCKLGSLTKLVLSGRAGDLDKEQYRSFLLTILRVQQESRGKDRVEAMGWISEKLDQCDPAPAAETAFKALAAEGTPKKKKKTWLFVLLGVVGALAIAAVLIFVVFRPFDKTEPDPNAELRASLESAYLDQESQLTGRFDLANKGLKDADLPELLRFFQAKDAFPGGQIPADILDDEELLGLLGYRTSLDLSGNAELSDLSALQGLNGLRKLYLDGDAALSALTGLEGLERLELLSLRGTAVSADAIAAFSEARPDCVLLWREGDGERLTLAGKTCVPGEGSLDLSGHGAALLRALDEDVAAQDLAAVQELHLGGAPLGALDTLARLPGLVYLDLSAAELQDEQLQGLTGLQRLAVLDLRDNAGLSRAAVDQLAPSLPGCTLLCSPFAEQPGAEMIYLAGESFPATAKSLDLSGRQLSEDDLAALGSFRELQRLDLSGSDIADLGALAGLQSLERLDIRGTAVTDLGPLCSLPRLEVLFADGNALVSLGAEEERPMAALRILSLSAGAEELDLTALRWMPHLTILDLGDIREDAEAPLTETLGQLGELKILRLRALDQLGEASRQILTGRCAVLAETDAAPAPATAPEEPAAPAEPAEQEGEQETGAAPTDGESQPETGAEG